MSTSKSQIIFVLCFLSFGVCKAQISFEKIFNLSFVGTGTCVQQTTDGGYIVVGSINPDYPISDIYLIKTDQFGDTLWTRSYETPLPDCGNAVQQTSDGGYIVLGASLTYPYNTQLIKLDSNGMKLWEKEYTDLTNFVGRDVRQTTDSGYVIVGTMIPEVYIIKTNSSGDTLWTKGYQIGGPYLEYSNGNFIEQTSDGGYIVSGTREYTQSTSPFLLKINNIGDTLWTKLFGLGTGREVHQTSDGEFIFATGGGAASVGSGEPPNLYKTDANGNLLWYKTYSDSLTHFYFNSVQQTADDGYVIAGTINDTLGLIKTDPSGDTLWTKRFAISIFDYPRRITVQVTNDEGYVLAGSAYSNPGIDPIIYLIKTLPDGSVVSVEKNSSVPNTYLLEQNYPNPFNPSTTIRYTIAASVFVSLKVYDVLGREVATLVNEDKSVGSYEVKFSAKGGSASGGNAFNLTSGIYFYRIQTGSMVETKKMILLK